MKKAIATFLVAIGALAGTAAPASAAPAVVSAAVPVATVSPVIVPAIHTGGWRIGYKYVWNPNGGTCIRIDYMQYSYWDWKYGRYYEQHHNVWIGNCLAKVPSVY